MIYFLLSKKNIKKDFHREMMMFVEKIKSKHAYKIIWCDDFIHEKNIEVIDNRTDVIFWESTIAYKNMSLVSDFKFSIVILERPTILIQKKSKANCVTENDAINRNFLIYYLKPDEIDETNREWKLIVSNEMWLCDDTKLNTIISNQNNNKNDSI